MSTTDSGIVPAPKRSSKMIMGSLFLISLLIGVIVFWVFHTSSDERRIQDLLDIRAEALEQKDLLRYLSCFSPDYRSGSRTYDDLKADASQWFSQFSTIRFSFQILDIQLQDRKAIVENNYKFSVTNADGELVQIAKRELLELYREHKGWKITKSLSIQ